MDFEQINNKNHPNKLNPWSGICGEVYDIFIQSSQNLPWKFHHRRPTKHQNH